MSSDTTDFTRHPAHAARPPVSDLPEVADVMSWRKAERHRLLALRQSMNARDRRRFSERMAEGLDCLIGDPRGLTISAYWPFRGEPDLRGWMERVSKRGGQCALPMVVERGKPLVFRAWQAGARMEPGVWDIPVPADGPEVTPDVVIAPVVGFDPACFRLGYGGGFYDRTLAAMAERPRVFGVGIKQLAMATIHPQPHDVPMDAVVSENGIFLPHVT